jgi:two-component system, OmpR family, response regulator
MRILLVEDEPEMAHLIVECLNQSGFDADHVATIGNARKSIGAHSYSLALFDRRLPDGDGVSLIEDIRRTHPGVRVLMLTALDSVSDKGQTVRHRRAPCAGSRQFAPQRCGCGRAAAGDGRRIVF